MRTYHVITVVVPADCSPETLTVAFDALEPVGKYIDDVFRVCGDDAAVAIAIDGQPQNWHRASDGTIVIDALLA